MASATNTIPSTGATPAPPPPARWDLGALCARGFMAAFPPFLGIGLLIGIWALVSLGTKDSIPSPLETWRQALDIFVALHTCAAGSKFVLPSRYDAERCMSNATLNRVTQIVAERAKAEGLPLEPFTVHDLRRTGSTLLNEIGFNRDWIEKCLAHEDGRSSRSIYNKAEYAEQRRHMLQEWADMIDAWVDGRKHMPVVVPPAMAVGPLEVAL